MHKLLYTILMVGFISSGQAEVLISSPPLSREHSVKHFQQLATSLKDVLGLEVSYVQQKDWLEYSKHLRSDLYDLVVSEAHVAAWLQLTGGQGGADHEVLAGMQGDHDVALVAPADSNIDSINGFVNQRVCVKPSPSIDSVRFYELFPNPIYQPFVYEINGSYSELLARLNKKRCKGAVVSYAAYAAATDLKLIKRFDPVPNVALTASPRLTAAVRQSIKQFLLNPENTEIIRSAMQPFVSDTEASMVVRERRDYQGKDKLLRNVWGW